MNVSLQGARSEARLGWDRLEEQRRSNETIAKRVFLAALAIVAAWVIWQHIVG
ncbi:MAG: hypothetical protein U1F08_03455 [Steroidobacteraceae bacterium]